jgi:hypothetical protein
MTTSIRKHTPTPLEQKYAEMRKESGDYKRNPNWVKNVDVPASNMPTDTVTLAGQDSEPSLKLKRSQSVSPVEKQALQSPFSVHV